MRYMEDFSAFGDRGVFDTVLWGRYMVYAAAFGISDKLMEQMERATRSSPTRSGPMYTRPTTAWCIGLPAAAPCGRAAALLACMACMQVGRSVRWSPTASRRWVHDPRRDAAVEFKRLPQRQP